MVLLTFSPEQWFATVDENDRLVDGRADIFSVGVIFYEMLTRKRLHLMIRMTLI